MSLIVINPIVRIGLVKMAIGLEQYRRSIGLGGFAPLKRRAGSCSTEPYISVIGALVVMSLILSLSNDVESNPGPLPGENTMDTNGSADPNVDKNTQSVLAAIHNMRSEMKAGFDRLDTRIKNIENENKDLRKEVEDLHRKMERMENETRKKRLLIYGVPGERGEPTQRTVRQVSELFDRVGAGDVKLDDVYRIKNAGSKKPIMINFLCKSDKFSFMDKLKSSNENGIYAKQDLPQAIRETRKKLSKFYTSAVSQGKTAKVVWDRLIVNGRAYEYTADTDTIKATVDGVVHEFKYDDVSGTLTEYTR